MRIRFIVPLLAVALVGSCASAGANGASGPKRSSDVITQEEIQQATGLSTAYDAVQRLRPQFLRLRGPGTITGSEGLVVFVDGMQQGGIEELRRIDISQVKQIRYVNARDATTKYGTGMSQGVIEVTTH
ncbi:MAG TPA: hypothetical protein VJ957_04245 [Longimicrobiales bacterium]|nr:hypothetical protein [Longimicrobiales bacterium]